MATVGSGKYTYRLSPDWARLPEGETFGVVSAVATDSLDRVYGRGAGPLGLSLGPWTVGGIPWGYLPGAHW